MSKVVKRASYSVIRNEKDDKRRVLQFSRMIMNNPGVLKYFKNRNSVSKPFVRLGEILKMTLFSEQHRRKEEIRSALYAFCEEFMGDKKLMHYNMKHRVTDLLKSVKENIENDTSINEEKRENIVDVLNEVLEEGMPANRKKGIDTFKIVRDKEWYRGFIRLLAAAGVLTGSLFLIPPQESNADDCGYLEIENTRVVEKYNNCAISMEQLESGIRGYKKKLDNCKDDNSALETLISYNRSPSNRANEKLFRANRELRRINNKLRKQLGKLRKQLKDQKSAKNKKVTLSKDFKQLLMRKVDLVFKSVMYKGDDREQSEDEMYYKSHIRPWFEDRINEDNMDVVWMVISMGGELFEPIINKGVVTMLKEFNSGQAFLDAYEEGNVVYPESIKNGTGNSRNTRPGTVSALFDVYLFKYNQDYE